MASKISIQKRVGEPPEIGQQPPQVQYSDKSPRNIYNEFCSWMFNPATFPKAEEKPTAISVKTSRALFLKEEVPPAHKDAFMPNGREFAHLHEDGSCHLVVSSELEDDIIANSWGVRHMYHAQGVKEILVYAPSFSVENYYEFLVYI